MKYYTRFEVIDLLGRALTVRGTIEAHEQDDGKTLKVFLCENIIERPAKIKKRSTIQQKIK